MFRSSFFAGSTTSTLTSFQLMEGVGLVRSQPRTFPIMASTRLGERNQYEIDAMCLVLPNQPEQEYSPGGSTEEVLAHHFFYSSVVWISKVDSLELRSS